MEARLLNVDDHGIYYTALVFVCPGCIEFGGSGLNSLPVNTTVKSPSWGWDGNLERPTLNPSILTDKDRPKTRCHSFLRNGVFEFLADSAHSLVGQHVEMPDLPDWFVEESE